MNIRHIETFICVAECGSFRRAAEKLHRSQSAVSVHVRQLEEELGVPLFDRTTRRVALTGEGRTMLSRAQGVVGELRAVAHELREASGVRGGVVSIGVTPSIAVRLLPTVLADFTGKYPRVNVRLHESFARGLYEDVRKSVTDFAIGPAVPGLKDFDYRTLLREPLVAIVPGSYPLRGRSTLTLKEIASQPTLSMPVGSYLRRVTEDRFVEQGLPFVPRFEVMNFQSLFAMVAGGLGVAIVPALSVSGEFVHRIQIVRVRAPALEWEVCILQLKGKRLSPPASRMADLVAQMVAASSR